MNLQAHLIEMQELIDRAYGTGEIAPQLMGEVMEVYQRAKVDCAPSSGGFKPPGAHRAAGGLQARIPPVQGFPGNKRSLGLRVSSRSTRAAPSPTSSCSIFSHELAEVNHHTKAQLLVTEFDTDCTEPKPPAAFRHTRQRNKKGGTDFRPSLPSRTRNRSPSSSFHGRPGIAPVEVNQRVLWVLTNGGSKPAVYGESVQFE